MRSPERRPPSTLARGMTRLIGIDVGTSSLKGLAIDEHGEMLAQAERAYPLSTPRPGWSEQDPELWWQAAQSVLEELDGDHADGIGLSGQMHGLVVLALLLVDETYVAVDGAGPMFHLGGAL